MNQYVDYKPFYSTARVSNEFRRTTKPAMVADFNPYMSGFNSYYNDNQKMMTVVDQYYQDFNIINNTVNKYSPAKFSPLQRRLSALDSKEFRKKFNVFMNRQESKAETKGTTIMRFYI